MQNYVHTRIFIAALLAILQNGFSKGEAKYTLRSPSMDCCVATKKKLQGSSKSTERDSISTIWRLKQDGEWCMGWYNFVETRKGNIG